MCSAKIWFLAQLVARGHHGEGQVEIDVGIDAGHREDERRDV